MAYFVIWRFSNEVDLSIYCRSVGNNMGGSRENVGWIYASFAIGHYRSGIIGTSVLGVLLFHEKLSFPQVICVMLIVVGIAGLKLLAKD